MKLVPFCSPKMNAMMKSIVLEKFNSSTSSGCLLLAASSSRGRSRSKIMTLEIVWTSAEDWR